jgi:hypothetical protein
MIPIQPERSSLEPRFLDPGGRPPGPRGGGRPHLRAERPALSGIPLPRTQKALLAWGELLQELGEEMSEFLDSAELHQLTGYARCGQQEAWLTEHGVPHKRDGKRLIVCRRHVIAWVEGRPVTASNAPDLSKVA